MTLRCPRSFEPALAAFGGALPEGARHAQCAPCRHHDYLLGKERLSYQGLWPPLGIMSDRVSPIFRSPLFRTRLARAAMSTALATTGLSFIASAHAADDRFKVKVSGQKVQVGKTQKVKIQLTADNPWHMNIDFPTSLKLGEVAGVTLGKSKFKKGDAQTLSEHKIVFMVPVTANKAGTQVIDGKLKFAICKEDSCSPAKAKVSLRIQASEPASSKKTKPTKPTKPKKTKSVKAKPRKAKKAAPSTTPLALQLIGPWLFDPTWGPGLSPKFFAASTSP